MSVCVCVCVHITSHHITHKFTRACVCACESACRLTGRNELNNTTHVAELVNVQADGASHRHNSSGGLNENERSRLMLQHRET